MVSPVRLTRKELEVAPYKIWNAFVDIVIKSDYDDLSEIQRVGHLALWYESEVANGGHLQYFLNHGLDHLEQVLVALKQIGASCQADVISRAATDYASTPRPEIQSAEEYVEEALNGKFDDLDRSFWECEPSITKLLETFLVENESEFVERVA